MQMAPLAHELYAFDRLERTHQNRMRRIDDVADDGELVIHPIHEINVSDSTESIHRLRPSRPTSAVSVRGAVLRTTICFHLDDHARHAPAIFRRYYQKLTEQIASNGEHVRPGVEVARQFRIFHWRSFHTMATKMISPIAITPRRTHN